MCTSKSSPFRVSFCALNGTPCSIITRNDHAMDAMIQWFVRNYLRKPTKQELDVALWQSQHIPAKSLKLTTRRLKKTSTVGLPQNFRYYTSSLRLLVLEVLVEGVEVLVEEACIIVPRDTSAEEVAREIRLKQHKLWLLASILRRAEGDVPTSERHAGHHSLVSCLAELRRFGSAREHFPWVDKSSIG